MTETTSLTASAPAEPPDGARAHSEGPTDILKDIQGGLIGFNKDHLRLLAVTLPDMATAKAAVAELVPHLTNGYEVKEFNALYSEINGRGGDPGKVVQARWVNLLLTRSGLEILGAPGPETLPEEFTQGMAGRSSILGDTGKSAPESWVGPFTGGAEPHAIIMIGADQLEGLEERTTWVTQLCARHGVQVIGTQQGDTRPTPNTGREHFGFKDGTAQPGIDRLTVSSKTGSGTIPLGEVLIGHPNAEGQISGQPSPVPPPAPTPYDPAPVPVPPVPMPEWMHNASFVVYRRLRQDAAAFHQAMNDQAPTVTLPTGVAMTPEQLSAKLVGRWPSGAPMERVPGMPKIVDPSDQDPAEPWPPALDKTKIDNFDYSDDPNGIRVPRAAHIRKMNPRADVLADGDTSRRHRMVRRGITYGPELQDGETPYGEVVPDTQDRGLLFINYQSSIARTFEFVQTRWSNREDFQQPGDGRDPLISQDTSPRTFNLPGHGTLNFEQWVFTTGGAYLVSLSLTGLSALASP